MKKTACLLFIGALMGATAAQAQARYTCRTANGGAYISDRPCSNSTNYGSSASSTSRNANSGKDGIVYYGPEAEKPRYEAPIPRIGEAPAHVKYMSPRCSSLNDALRTAHARGLTSDTISTMRRDYQRECAENEGEAHARLSQERGEKVQQKRAEQAMDKQEKERAALREQQCGESKRILVTKRARTDLTEGEKAELKRFEENYRARCAG